jgi:hypothetical protein
LKCVGQFVEATLDLGFGKQHALDVVVESCHAGSVPQAPRRRKAKA